MEIEQLKKIEYFTISIEIELFEFSNRFQNIFELPKMYYDYENYTEWCEIEHNGINYNISKPYKKETLTEWDSTIPKNCNFGISLGILKNTAFDDTEVNRIGNTFSTEFKTKVFYHRTWFGVGNNKKRNLVFE